MQNGLRVTKFQVCTGIKNVMIVFRLVILNSAMIWFKFKLKCLMVGIIELSLHLDSI